MALANQILYIALALSSLACAMPETDPGNPEDQLTDTEAFPSCGCSSCRCIDVGPPASDEKSRRHRFKALETFQYTERDCFMCTESVACCRPLDPPLETTSIDSCGCPSCDCIDVGPPSSSLDRVKKFIEFGYSAKHCFMCSESILCCRPKDPAKDTSIPSCNCPSCRCIEGLPSSMFSRKMRLNEFGYNEKDCFMCNESTACCPPEEPPTSSSCDGESCYSVFDLLTYQSILRGKEISQVGTSVCFKCSHRMICCQQIPGYVYTPRTKIQRRGRNEVYH